MDLGFRVRPCPGTSTGPCCSRTSSRLRADWMLGRGGCSAWGVQWMAGTGGATSRTLTQTFETQSVSQIQIASDYTWFPLHPPLRNVDPGRWARPCVGKHTFEKMRTRRRRSARCRITSCRVTSNHVTSWHMIISLLYYMYYFHHET